MAQFYAEIQGSKDPATRVGTKASGMSAHIRGWDIGVRVNCYVDENGKDRIFVSKTSGSNGGRSDEEIIELVEN